MFWDRVCIVLLTLSALGGFSEQISDTLFEHRQLEQRLSFSDLDSVFRYTLRFIFLDCGGHKYFLKKKQQQHFFTDYKNMRFYGLSLLNRTEYRHFKM